MLRRVVMVAAGVFVAGGLVFVAGLVYVVVRPEEGGVKAARQLTERVVTPATMRFVDAGTDQKTPYRDFVIADSDVDQLSEVRPPRGYRLQERFRNGAGPFPFGDSLMVAEWSGPDPRDDGYKECMIFLERTTSTPRDDAPSESGAAVEGSDQTKVRLSAVCEID